MRSFTEPTLCVLRPDSVISVAVALVTWMSIAVISIRFRLAFSRQQRTLSDLPFKAPLARYLAIWVIVLGALMLAANGWCEPFSSLGKTRELNKLEIAGHPQLTEALRLNSQRTR